MKAYNTSGNLAHTDDDGVTGNTEQQSLSFTGRREYRGTKREGEREAEISIANDITVC